MKGVKFWRGAFGLLLLLITWKTLTTDPIETDAGFALARYIANVVFHNEALADKVAHFFAYAALGATAAFAKLSINGRRWPVAIMLAAYGIVLEIAQGMGGVRIADPTDALANALGVFAVFPLALKLTIRPWRRV